MLLDLASELGTKQRIGYGVAVRDWALLADIDGTLVGEPTSTDELRELIRLQRARRGSRCLFGVATGRDIQSAREVLAESGFRPADFDALITSVGAELYLAGASGSDPGYTEHLMANGFSSSEVREVLKPMGLQLQPECEQFPAKVSYFAQDTSALRSELKRRLAMLNFPTQTVFCHDSYLDVAPAHGAKGGAVRFLVQRWGLLPSQVVVAGDSGNDLSMLAQEWPAIVVGNGAQRLSALRCRSQVYFAERGFAGGIIEGLRSLGFVP